MYPGFIFLFLKGTSTDQGSCCGFDWRLRGIAAIFNGFLQLLEQTNH
jgi:hypothetical protein